MEAGLVALRADLLADGGPRISTMRNYRFAILPYPPSQEFKLRARMRQIVSELRGAGWGVLAISLQRLLLTRLRAQGPAAVEALVAREKRLAQRDPERALSYLQETITGLIEGPDGIAADVVKLIIEFADAHPEQAQRSVIFIERAGALYPFHRSSALLKHIDGKTRNLPVVLLYPGERRDDTGLSFMGQLPADRDYRPRIYP